MTVASRLVMSIICCLMSAPALSEGSDDYIPAYESIQFPNGLVAILSPRRETRSVSIRVLVDVGQLDFDCADRELPHLAEHLMFSGTETHNERELDELIELFGGSWNATTHSWATTYELDIHHDYVYEGLDVLAEIFTDTVLTDDALEIAKDVVYQEAGGRPSGIQQHLYRNGLILGSADKAYRAFLPDSRAFCDSIPTTEHLSLGNVQEFLAANYVPANIRLIAVGAFDAEEMGEEIAATFGAMPANEPVARDRPSLNPPPSSVDFKSTLSPPLGSSSYVSLEFAVPRVIDQDKAALWLASLYFDQQLFDILRTQRGLAYSPGAQLIDFGDAATLELGTSVDPSHVEEVRTVLRTLVEGFLRDGIPSEDFERIRHSVLLQLAIGFETNQEIAEHFVSDIRAFDESGTFTDLEAVIRDIDEESTLAAARRYLRLQQALWYESSPTLTFGQLWILAVVPIAAILLVMARQRRRRVKAPGS